MTRFVIAIGPNAHDSHALDHLRRLDNAIQTWLLAQGVDLSLAIRAAGEVVNSSTASANGVFYLTATDLWSAVNRVKIGRTVVATNG